MYGLIARAIASLATLFIFCPIAMAQAAHPQPEAQQGSPWKYDGHNRVVGSGGPAPVRDLTGSWAGPRSGAGVPDFKRGEVPPMTPLGQRLFSANKSLDQFGPAGTNDTTAMTCDPLGFPRSAIDTIVEMAFATMSDRVVALYPYQQVWREIWMDGRELPKNVGAAEKGAPDPRYYGYSVGHWESDNILVVDTTGIDEKTWLNAAGYPHSIAAHVQERFTRIDHNNLQLIVTVDDPNVYTKPFTLGTEYFKWVPNQHLDERLCVPSEVIDYLKAVADPAGGGKSDK